METPATTVDVETHAPSAGLLARLRRGFWPALFLLYTVLFWVTYARNYTPTVDPDPDGYVTQAHLIQTKHRLVPYNRLPGYALFILGADLALPGDLATKVMWVQGVIGFLAGALLLHFISRLGPSLGPPAGLVFTVLHGWTSFWGVFTATMMSNFLGAILVGMTVWVVWLLWSRTLNWPTRLAGVLFTFVLAFVTVCVHPVNFMVLGLLVPAILGAYVIRAAVAWLRRGPRAEWRARFLPPEWWQWRAVMLLLVFAGIACTRHLSYRLLDHPGSNTDDLHKEGSRHFSEIWQCHQMLMRLPPAHDTPLDRAIEDIKNRTSNRIGWRVERLGMPPFYPEFMQLLSPPNGPIDPNIWKERVLAHPGAAAWATWEEFLHKYHVLATQSLPARYYWEVFPDNNVPYYLPDNDISLRRRLFWHYGINLTWVHKITDSTKEKKIWPRVHQEEGRIALAALLPLLGLFYAGRQGGAVPGVFLCGALWMIGFLVALAFFGFVNGRYFLPFFPFLYVQQAVGVGGLLSSLWNGLRALAQRCRPQVRPVPTVV